MSTERYEQVAGEIFAHPETAFEEVRAARTLSSWLADEGFAVEPGAGGLPTAFTARFGRGEPTVAVLLEYDALPGIGHGCGHHLIGAGGALAAVLAARRVTGEGSILAVGCPAEESGAGKALLVEAGVFDGVAAAMMFHPAARTVLARSALAAVPLNVRFHGRAAHAVKTPDLGRNALTAMIQFFVAVDGLRPRLGTWGRVNGIIRDGGTAANVIPDFTSAEFMVREATLERLEELVAAVTDCAQGVAAATGTTVEVERTSPGYAERRNNRVLLSVLGRHMRAAGLPIDPPDVTETLGSSDIGNVSLRVPTIHPTIRIAPDGTPSHSHAFAEIANTDAARAAVAAMAAAMADTIVELLTRPELLERAAAEFDLGGADLPGVPIVLDG
ncbi:M20 family metallopeptidase [Spirillospora sp. CA-255316]